jgi:hypothetical protein
MNLREKLGLLVLTREEQRTIAFIVHRARPRCCDPALSPRSSAEHTA